MEVIIVLTLPVGNTDYNGAGMESLFCGVTNCPIASLLICIELFGSEGMPCYLLAVALSYLFSGYHGLYSSQKILYSKFKLSNT